MIARRGCSVLIERLHNKGEAEVVVVVLVSHLEGDEGGGVEDHNGYLREVWHTHQQHPPWS